MLNENTKPLIIVGLIMLWGASVVLGLHLLWKFQSTPGPQLAASAPTWPTAAGFQAAPAGLTLLMFVHPRCPCTVASVGELRRVTRDLPHVPQIHLVILQPSQPDERWQNNELVQQAQQLPGSAVHWDQGGQLARLFGSSTSGQVLLYNAAGNCLFRGGVTDLRGQEGPSTEGHVLQRCIVSGLAADRHYPVYGCALQD
jgi:hypothetical protein